MTTLPTVIQIKHELHDLMVELGRSMRGERECCGLICGCHINSIYHVHILLLARNTRKLYGFAITRAEKERLMHDCCWDLLGVFHSHPRGSQPSGADLRQMQRAKYPLSLIFCSADTKLSLSAYFHRDGEVSCVTDTILWN